VSPEEDALRRVLALLDQRGIPYMLTGSVAASYHGRPRATHDADVVIDPDAERLDAFVRELDAAGFYVDVAGARAAFERRRQFNAIDIQSASKIDLIVRKDRPFSVAEFERRQRVDLSFASGVAVVSPEDAVLSKLEWAKGSDSERQLRDVANILEMNPRLDRQYVERWAGALGVDDLWRRVVDSR
jgi:Mg-chelatase subunit ChlI